MKYISTLFFILFIGSLYGQISLEVIGGVGFDIKKFETKYTNNRTPLTHSYTYNGNPNDIEFTILEPRYIGGRFLWKFSKKMNLSAGLEFGYKERNIIGTFYGENTDNPDWSFPKMDINIRQYAYGLLIRKDININQKNKLFIQTGLYEFNTPGKHKAGVFSTVEGMERIHEKNRQLVRYREGEEYYNLIQIHAISTLAYQFTQGYLMNITSNLSIGVSSTIHYEQEAGMTFIIWAWNNDEQRKAGRYSPNGLRFTSVMFNLFLTYEF